MFIPTLDLSNSSQKSLYSAIGYLGTSLLKNVTVESVKTLIDLTGSTFYWASANTFEEAIQLWDAGIYKVVFPDTVYQNIKQELSEVPENRIAISTSNIDNITFETSAVIVKVDTLDLITKNTPFIEKAKQWIKELLSQGGAKQVVIEVSDNVSISLNDIQTLQQDSLNILIPSSQLTTDLEPKQQQLNIGEAFMASVKTDRADGLYATLVVDELNNALGLVYSSKQSVSESIRTGQGVFQSRTRGLWYKGATSGATQTLKHLDYDCDSDALRFVVEQHGAGFCHLNTRTCFGADTGLSSLQKTLQARKTNAPEGSYTARLFNDSKLLNAKIMEEAEELCEAKEKNDIAWEAADLIYFALTKCISAGVTLEDIEKNLDKKARKITRRPGNAKPKWSSENNKEQPKEQPKQVQQQSSTNERIEMEKYVLDDLSLKQKDDLLLRPIIDSQEITARVTPIMKDVRERGDKALLDLTKKFDRVELKTPTIQAPFPKELMQLDPKTKAAIDQAYDNIYKFHDAQMDRETLVVETMPGVVCSRFARPIERVGLYVPGGTAVLPSTTLMLGIPAKVAGCSKIVIATPPRPDGSVVPEVLYVAHKVGATHVVLAGGAQAVAAMAYGTETVPKVDKICGPGNQYVTAAKMIAQNDTSCLVSIDMPAGPSEVLVIADKTCNPAYAAADLLSQAEHGIDSQVVLLAVDLTDDEVTALENQVHDQAIQLPRCDIIRQSIPKSYILRVKTMEEAIEFSNNYAPEHLILHTDNAKDLVQYINNAGSVFVGHYSPESMGDYASGTNHTLPTYGYSRMYSGVNTLTFVKHITSQELTAEGLDRLGDTVMQLAAIEGLDAHKNAVAIRVADIRN